MNQIKVEFKQISQFQINLCALGFLLKSNHDYSLSPPGAGPDVTLTVWILF